MTYVNYYKDYTLILSYNPCDIFKYFNVTELHGLSLKECQQYNNTTEDAYIAGLCNLIPNSNRSFVFINLSRCTDIVKTSLLVMHELLHLYFELNYNNLKEKEEEIITNAENESYKIIELINKIKNG